MKTINKFILPSVSLLALLPGQLMATTSADNSWDNAQPAQNNQAQEENTASDPNAENSEAGEDVYIVRGIRDSLNEAARKKRDADQIKEVIDAEDIGKLPDTNVAETLQRVTGVQINRDLGEGSEVSVRGFSQNRVEINGQTQVGGGADSGVSFEAVNSDAFGSIEVIKTPAADEVEGALGAIIRFNTRKPLDNPKFIASINSQMQYSERANEYSPKANLFLNNAWDVGDEAQFGANLSVYYQQRQLRQDFFDFRGWEAVDGFGADLDGDGVAGEIINRDENGIITDLQDGVYVPLQNRFQIKEQNRKTFSVTSALQFKFNDRTEIFSDLKYTSNKASDTQYQYTSAFNSALQSGSVPGNMAIRDVYQNGPETTFTENQTLQTALLGQVRGDGSAGRGVNLNILGSSAPNDSDIFTGSFGLNHQFNDRLKTEALFSYGYGKSFQDQAFTSAGVLFAEWPFYYVDFGADTDVPTVIPLQRQVNGRAVTAFSEDVRLDTSDLSSYVLNNGVYQQQYLRNDEYAFRLDFDYELDWGPITSFEFGGRWAQNSGKRYRDKADDTSNTDADGDLAGSSFADLEARFPGLTGTMPYRDTLAGATGDVVRTWQSLRPEYLNANLTELKKAAGIVLTREENWGYDVERSTYAGYVKANYATDIGSVPIRGNLGVRFVHTDQTATGGVNNAGVFTPLTVDKKYSDWLPSFNLVASLQDDLLLRFGAAKSMSRPSLEDVAPLVDVQFFAGSGRGGNPNLEPEEVFQLDLSVEKYIGKGNLISAAAFYKDFSERIESGIYLDCFTLPAQETDESAGDDGCAVGQDLIRVQTDVNAGSAKVWGVEVAWQQSLDFLPSPLDGFGYIVNYTFVDAGNGATSATGFQLPVQDLSRHSYNLIGYYEKYGFSARVAWNWRSKFFDERTSTNQASFAEPYGQLDVSASYDVNKQFTVTFEAVNVTNGAEKRYQELLELPIAYRVNDRRFLLGFRARY